MSVVKEKIRPQIKNGARDNAMSALLKSRNQSGSRKTKILRAGKDTKACIAISPNLIDLSAPKGVDNEPIGISVVGGEGIIIRGRVGLTASPGEIRIGGLWVMNDLLLSATPSTIVTPIPVMRFSPPLESIAKLAASFAIIGVLIGTTVAIGAA
tara:strand:+ start:386 stop:847 length:462 start_codon:yes stop_codon:yes gene_type:complete